MKHNKRINLLDLYLYGFSELTSLNSIFTDHKSFFTSLTICVCYTPFIYGITSFLCKEDDRSFYLCLLLSWLFWYAIIRIRKKGIEKLHEHTILNKWYVIMLLFIFNASITLLISLCIMVKLCNII